MTSIRPNRAVRLRDESRYVIISEFPQTDHIRALVLELPGFGDLLTSNIFVLGKGPITLIDTGPKFPNSLETVRSQLNGHGFDFPDIERIILTHGHIDHFGMASLMEKAAGHPIPIHLHRDDIWRTTREYIKEGLWSEEVMDFTRSAGMPEFAIDRIKRRSAFFKHLCDPIDGAIPMEDGEIFSGEGFSLEVIHTPGHSPGSCCLYETESKILFTGDHIIRHITPNPIMEVRKSLLSDPDYQSLRSYENSLARVEDLDVRYAFSGHGEFIDDVKGLISRYRHHHEQRKRQIHEAIRSRSRSIYDLAEELFPGIPESEIFLAVSEVHSHLEVLMNNGQAEVAQPGPPALFQAVGHTSHL